MTKLKLDLNCDYSQYQLGGICSGHGTCVDGICECDPYYTGRSDWINLEGQGCGINIIALKVLWVILLVMQLLCFNSQRKIISDLYPKHNNSFKAIWAKTSGRFTLCTAVLSLFITVCCVARLFADQLIDPKQSPVIFA